MKTGDIKSLLDPKNIEWDISPKLWHEGITHHTPMGEGLISSFNELKTKLYAQRKILMQIAPYLNPTKDQHALIIGPGYCTELVLLERLGYKFFAIEKPDGDGTYVCKTKKEIPSLFLKANSSSTKILKTIPNSIEDIIKQSCLCYDDATKMPYIPNEFFDIAFSFHTGAHYDLRLDILQPDNWPDVYRETARVLKKRSCFVLSYTPIIGNKEILADELKKQYFIIDHLERAEIGYHDDGSWLKKDGGYNIEETGIEISGDFNIMIARKK